MADIELVIGNKNYSSWSLRAYLALRQTNRAFDETLIQLGETDSKQRILAKSGSGLVPALRHGDVHVFESLAIAEYLAETFPSAGLWPDDRIARARARSVAAEMHAGFSALRTHMPMNMRAHLPERGRGPGVADNIERIAAIWRTAVGPFLFGEFTIADAFFAPVVSRFRSYEVDLDHACRAYADAVWSHPPMAEWFEAANAEPWQMQWDVV